MWRRQENWVEAPNVIRDLLQAFSSVLTGTWQMAVPLGIIKCSTNSTTCNWIHKQINRM